MSSGSQTPVDYLGYIASIAFHPATMHIYTVAILGYVHHGFGIFPAAAHLRTRVFLIYSRHTLSVSGRSVGGG